MQPPQADRERSLAGQRVAFTGRLASLTHQEAIALVRARGGDVSETVTRETTLLVIGQEGWPLQKSGQVTQALVRAKTLARRGQNIRIVAEVHFLDLVGASDLHEEICGRYHAAQLTAMLGITRAQLRNWMQMGLIEPAATVDGLDYFDFREASRVRALAELLRSDVSRQRIRRGLHTLKCWLGAEAGACLDRLTHLGSRLVLRDASGALIEPSGQRLFEFHEPSESEEPAVRFEVPLEGDQLFEQALAHEDARQFAAAVETYEKLLRLEGPDPDVCFNLANNLLELGRREAAIERFRQVVEIDPYYAEAWNNLGVALTRVKRPEDAVEAFRQALAVDAECADAHYGMADTLEELGRFAEAQESWTAYLALEPDSERAAYARSRLEGRA